MSYEIRARIIHDRDLSITEKGVLLVLEFHFNDKTGQCNPSLDLLEAECHLSRRGLLDILERLTEKSALKIERHTGRGNSNSYALFPGEVEKQRGIKGEVDDINSEVDSPFSDEERVKLTTVKGEVGSIKGEVDARHIRTERERTIKNENTTAVVAGAREVSPPPPRIQIDVSSPIFQALFTVCFLDAEALQPRDEIELRNLLPFFAQAPTPEVAAAEILRRFSRPIWEKRTAPRLSQIKRDWKIQGDIADQQENQNGTHSQQPAAPRYLTPRQQAARKLNALLESEGIR